MNISLAIVILSLAGFAQSKTHEILENLISGSRIVDGWPAADNQFPHQVGMVITSVGGKTSFCGGSLISSQWVLTAGHCFTTAVSMQVSIGGININNPTHIVDTDVYYVHPDYNGLNLNNDIALVDLAIEIPNSETVNPIRLPRISELDMEFVGMEGLVSGWGYTQDGGILSPTLNYLKMIMTTNERCCWDYGEDVVIDSTLCAIGFNNYTQSTCNGDSGGALIFVEDDDVFTQIGIVSFVSLEGCSAYCSSGFVRPAYYLEWIKEMTGIQIRP